MKNIFDWLKAINNTKPPVESFTDKDWEVWNSYMIHRFLSMNPDYIEVVKRMIYNVYREFIPKNNKWSKYIKSKVKQPNTDLVNHIKDNFQCSSKEAKEYITLLDTPQISRILSNRGLNIKEIKPLLK